MHTTFKTFGKTRIAPTPSGYLHLGNALSFILTAWLAQQTGAKILLRIDDMDRDRVNSLYVQDVFDTLDFLGIAYHEGPRNLHDYENNWSQMHRMAAYRNALQQLINANTVFACNCSRSQIHRANTDDTYPGTCVDKNLAFGTPNVSWRLKTNMSRDIYIKTLSGQTITTQLPLAMQNFVVRKKDEYPAYQLTSVLDDLYYGVDLIVRGQDLWDSTLAQHALAAQLGNDAFGDIAFFHHPLLMADDKKLSKSAGDTSISYLRKQGKKPGDIFTAIACMLGNNTTVKTWQELAGLVFEKI